MNEKKFYIVQEANAGIFRTLSTKGFRPRNEYYHQLTFDESTATSLAASFTEECRRKCWVEEVN